MGKPKVIAKVKVIDSKIFYPIGATNHTVDETL